MTPHSQGKVHQKLVSLLSDAMAMASEIFSGSLATIDPLPEDLRKATELVRHLHDTMQAACTPEEGQHAATEFVPLPRTYANAA
jgi:hypothetical protein